MKTAGKNFTFFNDCPKMSECEGPRFSEMSAKSIFFSAFPYRCIHADLAQGVVLHGVRLTPVLHLLPPQPLNDLQELLLLHTPLEVYPEHTL